MRVLSSIIVITALLCIPLSTQAAKHAEKKEARTAIVLASFGSTVTEAQDAEAAFVREAEKRYAPTRVVLANTARMVMAKNAANGIVIPSLFRALADLADQGYTRVAVQSLQLIPGAEYDGIAAVAKAQEGLPKGLEKIGLGAPLMASNEDCEKVAAALIGSLPKERKAGEPVVFVGHGARHGIGGMVYPALQWHMANRDAKIFISTLEGTPDRETTLKALGKPGAKKPVLWVAPLLGLAGDHAVNDLYGGGEDSWKSVLTKEGWQVKEAFTPLYGVPAIREIWFDHLDAALLALKNDALQ
ncbi:Sirohydrochlorin cobaltochelatase CbiKP [uncultured delta proteobacterium]|uniref:Sirohydrochlorin cobaltochelatase CbiKP n=1 Tax=uncultured delta proteobacterium TaxID=34034 RepID=A0A212JGQ5_9DELT|nr:Sirohydrochlorin cobaltochelatase CbiKP [uncultured delta proteobacterium]